MADPSSHHRHVDVQSAHDLDYLHSNLSRAARQRIDLHLPSSAADLTGEDDLRRRVEALVEDFIQQTFTAVRSNSSINGLAFPSREDNSSEGALDPEEQYEPHSAALATKCQTLSSQLEQEILELSDLRREAPVKYARLWRERIEREERGDERRVGGLMERAEEKGVKEGEVLRGVGMERGGEIRETYERAGSGLEGLRDGVTGLRAKLERAQSAVEYFEGR
ncbi:MAG: hypothetical protein M1814_001268 [Vezdaea aestivalis]|nr:MAG: hypothetical protein M1814_001268 [Vezdaea aestivalis]